MEKFENANNLDPVLAPPLHASYRGESTKSKHSQNDPITTAILPLLYRMYVAAQILRLGTEARYSALVLMHRYARAVSELSGKLERPTKWVAATCLFLATKSEEEPRRLRDVINLGHMILGQDSDENGGAVEIDLDVDPPALDEDYWETKKKIVQTEHAVLRWLGFDVLVSHPHRAVVLMLQHLPYESLDDLAIRAARRLNDGLFYGPALQHNVKDLACAAIELAKRNVTGTMNLMAHGWWTRYGVTDDDLEATISDLQKATVLLEDISRT